MVTGLGNNILMAIAVLCAALLVWRMIERG